MKFYRGAARAARAYVERDRSRADDYYLAEGTGVAQRLVATPAAGMTRAGAMDGDVYERWVAGVDVDTGQVKGRVRQDANALRFVEVVVNGPKTWSLAAALHPEVSAALDEAQDEAAAEIVAWLAQHATTRVGPRGRQVQIPVERLETAVIRHYTSRAGDPHRHLHLQVNARVWAAGAWRGLHSVGVRDSIEAINGIGHGAVAANPRFRQVLAAHGYTLDPETGEIRELRPYAGAFSARAGQIRRHVDTYEATWRADHAGEEPGPRLREAWDRRAWATARPDKVVPADGRELVARWNAELYDLGYRDPTEPAPMGGIAAGWVDRDTLAERVVAILGRKRSAWNVADIRGFTETLLAQTGLVAEPAARIELAEDITARALGHCTPLLDSRVPDHIRSLTSPRVLEVEAEIIGRLADRSTQPARPARPRRYPDRGRVRVVDPAQVAVVGALAGNGRLVVVEGAAGTGKTTALRTTREALALRGRRLVVLTPTLKAAHVAAAETGADGHSAAWLIHQHGWRWADDGTWTRHTDPQPSDQAKLRPGDLLLVDEAGMLDQDTGLALLTIADETGARIAFIGDRHQLPAVGRGGLFDHAHAWAHPTAVVTLETVRRFTDPGYAELTLAMRTGTYPARVFDQLHSRGLIVLHPTEVERTAAMAKAGARGELVIADGRESVADLNAAIHQQHSSDESASQLVTGCGEEIGIGDRVATRRNDPALGVANRQTWTVTGIGEAGELLLHGHGGNRLIPANYAARFIELGYATTVHGAQGDTVDHAHAALDETTTAAATYVAMTRGRKSNTAHLVADDIESARAQWTTIFSRDRVDLGPAHARQLAGADIDRYGTTPPPTTSPRRRPGQVPPTPDRRPSAPSRTGIGV